MKNKIFYKDLYRYYGSSKESFIHRIFRQREIKYIYLFRAGSICKSKILKYYYKFRLKRISEKTNIQIPIGTQIGEGFYIGHCRNNNNQF